MATLVGAKACVVVGESCPSLSLSLLVCPAARPDGQQGSEAGSPALPTAALLSTHGDQARGQPRAQSQEGRAQD